MILNKKKKDKWVACALPELIKQNPQISCGHELDKTPNRYIINPKIVFLNNKTNKVLKSFSFLFFSYPFVTSLIQFQGASTQKKIHNKWFKKYRNNTHISQMHYFYLLKNKYVNIYIYIWFEDDFEPLGSCENWEPHLPNTTQSINKNSAFLPIHWARHV